MNKKVVFILAAHEPTLDPRLDWIASSAAARYDTRMFGFHLASRPSPDLETVHGYSVTRLTYAKLAPIVLAGWLLRVYFTPQSHGWRCAVELTIKAIALLLLTPFFGLVVGIGLLASGLAMLHPIQWAGACFHGFRQAYARRTSQADYKRTRNVAHAFMTGLRAYVLTPVSGAVHRWFPWLIRLRDAVNHRMRRLGRFIHILKYLVSINGSLLRVGREAQAPDLLYCNDLETLIAGVLLKAKFRCRLIYDAHEYLACAFPDYLWVEAWWWAALERFLVSRADAAFTVNPLLAAVMSEAYGFPFQSLPNCEPVRPDVLTTRNADRKKLETMAQGRTRFIFQGNIEDHRGLEEVILAWARVDSTRAVLFVRGPESSLRTRCMELAADLHLLNDAIFFPDAVRELDLVSAAAQADVGIIPYKPICVNNRLACPNKTSQYMQAGLAVLTNNLEYVKQLVADFNCGLTYDSSDMASFAAAVHRLASDADLLRTFQENARSKFLDVFNWEVQSRDLFETCERLLNGVTTATGEAQARRAA